MGIQRALQENFKFTPMALEQYWALGHSEGTLGIGHSRHLGTWALDLFRKSETWRTLGHLSDLGTRALRHLGNEAVEGHLSTQALSNLDT